MRWNEEETFQFVKIYLAHEYLWNTDHPSYKVKSKREQGYSEIIDEFRNKTKISLTDDDVRRKIKNLRSTYSQEVTKILRRSSPESTYRPAMKWFSAWHKCFAELPGNRLKEVNTEEETEDCVNKWDYQDMPDNVSVTQSDPFDSQNDYIIAFKSEPEPSNLKRRSRVSTNYENGNKKVRQSSPINEFPESTVRNHVDLSPEVGREDEFDIYGKYIALQLRKMDLRKALKLKLEIHSLINEARITDI